VEVHSSGGKRTDLAFTEMGSWLALV